MRDRNDRQQPTNLRVLGTTTQTVPRTGKIYELSGFQIFQGDLIRGYNSGSNSGRRVLAQPLHSIAEGLNPTTSNLPVGSIPIAEDGSTAAFVPAGRALSWQLIDANGEAVVRERYWLTFQQGEIRVCASCHGINTADHTGRAAPQSEPLALSRLLERWKTGTSAPTPSPSPSPTPESPLMPGGDEAGNKNLTIQIDRESKNRAGGKFVLSVTRRGNERLEVKISVAGKSCRQKHAVTGSGDKKLTGRFSSTPGRLIKFSLFKVAQSRAMSTASVRLTGRGDRPFELARECKGLFSSIK